MSDARKPSLRQYEAAITLLILENDSLRELAGVKTLTLGEREYCEREIERGSQMGLNAFSKGTSAVFRIES